MSLAGKSWSDLITEKVSCFFGGEGRKRIKEQEQTPRKGRLVETRLLVQVLTVGKWGNNRSNHWGEQRSVEWQHTGQGPGLNCFWIFRPSTHID